MWDAHSHADTSRYYMVGNIFSHREEVKRGRKRRRETTAAKLQAGTGAVWAVRAGICCPRRRGGCGGGEQVRHRSAAEAEQTALDELSVSSKC